VVLGACNYVQIYRWGLKELNLTERHREVVHPLMRIQVDNRTRVLDRAGWGSKNNREQYSTIDKHTKVAEAH